jgi:hypothetical protein
MIETVLIFSKQGTNRFIKIFSDDESQLDKDILIKNIYNEIMLAKDSSIIFDFEYINKLKRKLVYRLYGSIFIVLIIDDAENELAMLDFISVMMGILDEVFKGISELHLIMNPEKLYLLIDEMISGGIVIETSKTEIINNYLEKMKD